MVMKILRNRHLLKLIHEVCVTSCKWGDSSHNFKNIWLLTKKTKISIALVLFFYLFINPTIKPHAYENYKNTYKHY